MKKPSGITELSVKTLKIKVNVDNSVKKEFKNISVVVENLGAGYKANGLSDEDTQVTVVVEGSSDIVDNLDPTTIKAYVDLKDLGVGEHEVPVKVKGSDLKLTYESKTKKVKIKISEDK